MLKMRLYTILKNNIDKLITVIYRKAAKETVNIGSVAKLFEIGIKRFTSIIRWIYFGFFITILTYIVSIWKYIENIIIIIFSYMQQVVKYLIEFLITITGPLSPEVLNNIWLFIILLCILIVIIVFNKVIRYLINVRKERKKELELLVEELLSRLKVQDEQLKDQLKELKELKEKKEEIKVNDFFTEFEERKKENIKEINVQGVIYKIDINKLR